MRTSRAIATGLLAVVLLGGAACQNSEPEQVSVATQIESNGHPDGWETFTAGRTSALMPQGVESTIDDRTPGATAAIYEAGGDDYSIRLAVIDYTDEADLDIYNVAGSAMEDDYGTAVEFENIEMHGQPAVEGSYTFTGPNGQQGIGMVVAVDAYPGTVIQLRLAGSVVNTALMSMFEVARLSLDWSEIQA